MRGIDDAEPQFRGRADVLAIGAGPANLSLAALADPVTGLDVSVLEARPSVAWHPGLLWNDSRLQVSPLKDLVTLVDPTSRFSFLSFLRERGRLHRHIIASDGYVHRTEFSQYFEWAAQRMDVKLNERVVRVEHDHRGFAVDTNRGRWIAKHLVLGTGSVPDVPAFAAAMPQSRVWHVADHLSRADSLAGKRVAVVGGGQSAGEVMLDALSGNRGMPATVTWIAGRSGLRPLDQSPFTNEFFNPRFARYFQVLPEEHRRAALEQQMPAVKGITADLLHRIYTRLYELDYLTQEGVKYRILSGVELRSLSDCPAAVSAEIADPVSGSRWTDDFDAVLLATGFRQELPEFMAGLRPRIPADGATYAADTSFRVLWDGPDDNRIYFQGADPVSIGVGGQTLALASWRSATIVNSLLGRSHYDLDGDEISIRLPAHPPEPAHAASRSVGPNARSAEKVKDKHAFSNLKKADSLGSPFWDRALDAGVHEQVYSPRSRARVLLEHGECVNMSSYSYLGLDEHPDICQAAADQVRSAGVLNSSLSRVRMTLSVLDEAESALSDLFGADVGTIGSCASAAWAMLPMLAAGLLTDGTPPLVVFDQHAHFCMKSMKALCADETDVATIRHNDVEALEDLCRRHDLVAYIGDSVYSTYGSVAPIAELAALQSRYGLFLFLDDAHGTSVIGRNGRGYALEMLGGMNDRMMVITSLNKGFGASGGAIMFRPQGDKSVRRLAIGNGGPFMWSQRINTAGLGGILASVRLHRGAEVPARQAALQKNIQLFDELYEALGHGNGLPVRYIPMPSEETAIKSSEFLLGQGFYVEPDFFPIVKRGGAGLRVRLRSNMSHADIAGLCSSLNSLPELQGISG